MKRMRGKGWMPLLVLCLLVMLMPTVAFAAEESPILVANQKVMTDTYYKISDSGELTADGSKKDYNVHLSTDGDKYVLTLNNATIHGADGQNLGAGIYYNGGESLPLEIVLKGTNSVTSGKYPSGWSNGIVVESQSLRIRGDGALNITSDTYDSSSKNYGGSAIYVIGGNLTISGGTVTALAGDAATYREAIYASGNITIEGGTVYANSTSAGNQGAGTVVDVSVGICAGSESSVIKITGGTIYAYGGTANGSSSVGIYSAGTIEITGGTVTGVGGPAPMQSSGIAAASGITIDAPAVVNGTGGTVSSGESYGIGVTSDSGSVAIDGGTITAQGGNVEKGNSYGIGCNGIIDINGGTITSDGGTASNNSYGIGAKGGLDVSGGTVTATGGQTSNGDSCGIGITGSIGVGGGDVTATGGSSSDGNSYGIGSEASFNATGGVINAKGGSAPNGNSYGIGANNNININGSLLTAEGGDQALESKDGKITLGDGSSHSVFGGSSSNNESELNNNSNVSKYKYIRAGVNLKVSFAGNGSTGGTTSSMSVVYGDTIQLPSNGFDAPAKQVFKAWAVGSADGEQYAEGASYVVTADTQFYAVWEEAITISVSASPSQGGTVTGGGNYKKDASVTVTATANDGYQFVKWTKDGEEVSTDASYTFVASSDCALVAVFEKIPTEEKTTEEDTEEDTEESITRNNDVPDTGDDSFLGMWIGLLLISVMGIAVIELYSRQCKEEN